MRIRIATLTCVSLAASTLGWTLLALAVTAPASGPTEEAVAPTASLDPAPLQGGFGTIKGQLVWGGDKIPERAVMVKKGDTSVKDAEVCAAVDLLSNELVVDPKTKGVRHAFAFLKTAGLAGKNAEAEKALLARDPEVIVDQKNCDFIPYATAVFTGQKVVFKSSDPVGHNLRYSGFKNTPKNVVIAPQGQLEEKLQSERLPMELKCDIHPWMKGWVLPLDHPFFAVTKEDGSFEISGVPPGKHTLIIWQEKVGYANPEGSKGTEVQVEAGKVSVVPATKLDPGKIKK